MEQPQRQTALSPPARVRSTFAVWSWSDYLWRSRPGIARRANQRSSRKWLRRPTATHATVILRCALLRASKDGRGHRPCIHPSRLAEEARTSSDERNCAHAGMTAVVAAFTPPRSAVGPAAGWRDRRRAGRSAPWRRARIFPSPGHIRGCGRAATGFRPRCRS
jgi:hypothetical protein